MWRMRKGRDMNNEKRIFLLYKSGLMDLKSRFEEIGVHPYGIKIMEEKFKFYVFYITNLTPVECNILKQEALSCGAEAAVPRGAVECKITSGNVLLSGTEKELRLLSSKLKNEPFFLKELGDRLESILSDAERPVMKISKDRVLRFDQRPLIMGILNVTPDSFSDGGKFYDTERAIEHGVRLAKEGADIIDVGGESTRPNSTGVSAKEEMKRVIPVIKGLIKKVNTPVSIDTTKSAVAEAALSEGATIINDISGLRFDKRVSKVAAKYKCGLILMHTRGKPSVMQKGEIKYENLLQDITDYLDKSIRIALDNGVDFESIAIDPGIGFGKTPMHNIQIIRDILAFRTLNRPVLIGASRKSFIGFITGREIPEREDATTAVSTILTLYGVDILRVHNVRATIDAIKIARALIH
jgi:dihydropteroate synthase